MDDNKNKYNKALMRLKILMWIGIPLFIGEILFLIYLMRM